jgi:hypothetical protein
LLLSCIPCADKEEFGKGKDLKTEISPINKQNKHQTENEACTPFCTCSCCAASAFFHPIVHYKIPKRVFHSLTYPSIKDSYSSQSSYFIWQPPKLS